VRQRPLGVTALEDKIVQRAAVEVLNAIYAEDFRGFLIWIPPGAKPAHGAGPALSGDTRKVGELGARSRHSQLLRHFVAEVAGQVCRARDWGPARAAHSEMTEGGRAGRGEADGE